jgi:hypothetical protein
MSFVLSDPSQPQHYFLGILFNLKSPEVLQKLFVYDPLCPDTLSKDHKDSLKVYFPSLADDATLLKCHASAKQTDAVSCGYYVMGMCSFLSDMDVTASVDDSNFAQIQFSGGKSKVSRLCITLVEPSGLCYSNVQR